MTPLETTITVEADGTTAHFDLPAPLPPGRHAAIVVVDTALAVDVHAWLQTIRGAVSDDFAVPPELPLREIQGL